MKIIFKIIFKSLKSNLNDFAYERFPIKKDRFAYKRSKGVYFIMNFTDHWCPN